MLCSSKKHFNVNFKKESREDVLVQIRITDGFDTTIQQQLIDKWELSRRNETRRIGVQ